MARPVGGHHRDLTRLKHEHPMVDAVIDEQIGRRIRIGDHWLTDWASCNYLGFDLDEEIMAAVPEYLASWGTHPSWSRLLGSPRLYEEIETTMTDLLGCEDVLLLPTITHIHMSVCRSWQRTAPCSWTAGAQDDLRRAPWSPPATAPGSCGSGTTTSPHLEELLCATPRSGPRDRDGRR
jgi:8-amino-7-oxononanoate synthase